MKSILTLINEIPDKQWDYYLGMEDPVRIQNPFSVTPRNHNQFIHDYFLRGGKSAVMESVGIDINSLRLPNHINSVFFIGILLYYNTSLHKKHVFKNNDPGYNSFPFIWFLIALFHDNAYQMEKEGILEEIKNIDDLKIHFDIQYFLFDKKIRSKCSTLLNARLNYFNYRKKIKGVIDHGLLGGIILYDKLVKIRKEKRRLNKLTLFWGKKLEYQYLLAASAISLHNIWLPDKKREKLYIENGLESLLDFTKVNYKDFPLFYILGVVDTIEPLKIYRDEKPPISDDYILENIQMKFEKDSLIISKKTGSTINFDIMLKKAEGFKNWLDLDVEISQNNLKLTFH